jgi:hypothetical protein
MRYWATATSARQDEDNACYRLRTCALVRLSLLAALLLLITLPALGAGSTTYEDPLWQGRAVDEDGRFSYCVVSGSIGYGTRASFFVFSPDAALAFALFNDAWTTTPGVRTAVTVQVDQEISRRIQAEQGDQLIVFELGTDPDFFTAMRYGKRLHVIGAQDTVTIELTSTAGIGWLEDCFTANSGLDLSGEPRSGGGGNPFAIGSGSGGQAPAPSTENPFAPAPSPAPSPGGSAGGDIAQLRDLLIQMGYPSPEIGDVSDQEIGFAYGWVSDRTDLVGFLAIDPPDSDIRQHLIQDIAALSEICGGRGGQPLYDTILTSASGDTIYSGRADCGGEQGAIFFVATASAESVLMFMHIAGPGELGLALQINANIRTYLRRL